MSVITLIEQYFKLLQIYNYLGIPSVEVELKLCGILEGLK